MKHLSGTELEEKMEEYTRATHLFEQKNGFAYKSEITGILKGLGFQEEDFQKKNRDSVRRTKDKGRSRKTPADEARDPSPG